MNLNSINNGQADGTESTEGTDGENGELDNSCTSPLGETASSTVTETNITSDGLPNTVGIAAATVATVAAGGGAYALALSKHD